MQYDRGKLKSVILYTCAKCEPSHLGAVKLHKVLYFVDMIRFAQTGTPVTGATYRKRPLGPTCDQLLPTLRELENAKALSVNEVDYFGYRKKEFVAIAEPDLARLGQDEISLLEEVIDFVCAQNTAKTISEYSHNRAWEQVEFGEVLKYTSAFLLFPTQVSPEAMEWASGEGLSVDETRSENKLAGKDFGTFRSEVLSQLGT
ncbi:MAG: Panacea domain-containing protein [Rhodomicrobium sp.]